MSQTAKAWGYGLASTFISASAGAIGSLTAAQITGDYISWKFILVSALCTGAIAAANYLKESPLPKGDDE